jgi:hypothetical protein
MNMEKPFFIHIGYGKTGSSWLQEKLFCDHRQIHYFGQTSSFYPKWLMELHYGDEDRFDREKSRIKATIMDAHARDDGRVCLLSSEPFTNFGYLKSQAKRIQAVFPNPRIIMVLRHPIDLIESFYKHNVREGHFFLPIEEYLDWKTLPFALHKRPPVCLPDLFFDDVIDYYAFLFKRENILVLQYEHLANDPNEFASRLGDFIGVDFGDVSRLARERVLPGLALEKIEPTRRQNLDNVLEKAGFALRVRPQKTSGLDETVIIDNDLRARLNDYFSPKCSMYFNHSPAAAGHLDEYLSKPAPEFKAML